jgi:hypothetical protein
VRKYLSKTTPSQRDLPILFPIKTFKWLEINMYIYDEGVRRSVRGLGYPLSEEFYYYNESLAGRWQGII